MTNNPLTGLPTDSLYKFMALSGVVTMLLVSWFYFTQKIQLELRLVDHGSYAHKLGDEVAALQGEARAKKLHEAQELIKADHEKHQILVSNLGMLRWMMVIGVSLGAFLAFEGFWLWFHRIQKFQDLLLQKQCETPEKPEPPTEKEMD